jgi:hypothetical protein
MLGFGDVCGWHTLGQDIIPMANGWRKEVISSPRNNCRLMAAGAEKSCSDDQNKRPKQFSDQWPAACRWRKIA